MVSEGSAERRTGTLRAEVALRTIASEPAAHPAAPERLRRVLEQALVFTGATLAAVYALDDDGDLLRLVESAGVPRTLYGLRESYPADGRSPAARVHRDRRPLWLGPAPPDESAEPRPASTRGAHLAALPVRGGADGCLLAVSESPGGFDTEDRKCLELVAEAVVLPTAADATTTAGVRAEAAEAAENAEAAESGPDAFSLAMDSGRVDAGDALLELFGLNRADFDGRVETLLGLTVPEDLPSLMSVVEADHMSIGDRELEFRVLRPDGPPRWVRLRGRLVPGGIGRAHV